MNNTILMLLPTRSRPQKAWEAVQSFHATNSGSAQLLLCLDEDDPELDTYRVTMPELATVGPRIGMAPSVNRAIAEFPDYAYYGFFGDDHRFRTPGWDRIAIDTIEAKGQGWGVFYGDDLLKGQALPTAVVISGNIVRTLGWMCLPGCRHMYVDDVWKAIGQGIDRLFYDSEVVIEHCHYTNGKSAVDAQYLEVNSTTLYSHDGALYQTWYTGQREEDLKRIRQAMAESGADINTNI